MKRKILLSMLLTIMVACPLFGQATNWNINGIPNSDWWGPGNDYRNVPLMWMRAIDPLIASAVSSGAAGIGSNFYVDSEVTLAGDGSSWANAVETFDEAVALCTANMDDNIHIAAGHGETWSTADMGATLDIIGINIIGYGNGSDMPTFTYTHAGATIDITVANVSISNLRFVSGVSAVVSSMTLAAGADYLTVSGCEWVTPGTAAFEFYDMITLAAGSDYVKIVGNTFASLTTTTGCNHAINGDAGVVNRLVVVGNEFSGQFIVAAIHSDDTDLNILIAANTFHNATTTQHCIEFATGAATGVCAYNLMYTDTIASTLDPGSMACFENYVINTTDLSAILVPAPPALSVQTQTAGSIGDILAKMYYAADGSGAYPATVANDSTFAKIMASDTPATSGSYDNQTDSLEAISDAIGALTGVGFRGAVTTTTNTTTINSTDLAGFGEDYFNTGWYARVIYDQGAAGAAPEGDVRDIVDYTNAGVFTVGPAFGGTMTSGDLVMIVRVEDMNFDSIATLGGSGRIVYVDSGVAGTADVGDLGDTWDLAYPTLTAALDAITDDNGDVIYVAAGHNEDISGAYAINDAGVKIIGLGDGDERPQLEFSATGSQLDVSVSDVTFENIDFLASVSDIVAGIDVTTGGDGLHLKNCRFRSVAAADEFLIMINLQAAADDILIEGCEFLTPGAAATEGIYFAGATDNFQFIGNYMQGDWTVSAIWSNSINTLSLIKDNVILQDTANQHCIEFPTTATGTLVGNKLYSDVYGSMLDPGSMICVDNLGTDVLDQQAIAIPLSAETSDIAEEDDGSDLERLEYLQNKSDDILAMLRATGGNVGDVYYVDSVTGGTDGGTSWDTAEATLALGYAEASANKGDIVFLAANHGETVAGAVALASAGVSVIGIGYGDDRPLITMTAALSSFDIGAADNLFENIVFHSTTINTTIGIDVADAGDGFILRNCEFTDTGGFEFDSCIDIKASADRVTIEGNRMIGGAAGTQAILKTAGVTDRMTIVGNYIYGNYSAAGIFSDDADTHVLVKDNIVSNLDTGAHAVEFSAAALGQCIDNYLMGDTYGAILDPGSMRCFGNLQCLGVDSGAIDVPLIAGKTYAIAVSVDEVTANIIDIQNGGILIHSIFAEVDVVIGAVATNCNLEVDAADGAAWDTDLSTTVAVTDDVAGTRWFMDDAGIGTNPPVLDPRKGGATEGTLSASPAMYVPEGLLIQAMSADPGGAGGDHVTWYITFSPVEENVVVVPQ